MMTKSEPKIKEPTASKSVKLPSAEELVKAGAHLGHRTTKWNPKMEQYIFTSRGNVHIIDVEKTLDCLKEAVEFASELVSKGGNILFIGTSPAAASIAKELAIKAGMPYVVERWLGGTLTNFKIISKRLEYFRNLENKRDTGELKKYTKKEQLDFNEKLSKLEKKFGGIKNLTKTPDALFVLDPKKNHLALKEARMAKVKTIALCDTNIDPDTIDYPIPVNDDALSSLRLVVETIVSAIEEGKKRQGEAK